MGKYPSCVFRCLELRFFYQHFGAPPISLEEFEARPQAGKGGPPPVDVGFTRWGDIASMILYLMVVSNIFYFHPYLGKIPILNFD